MKLPTIPVSLHSRNPDWILNPSLPLDQRMDDYWITFNTEAEVLTIHLQKYTMRIRYKDACGQTQIKDMDAGPFFKKYNIEAK